MVRQERRSAKSKLIRSILPAMQRFLPVLDLLCVLMAAFATSVALNAFRTGVAVDIDAPSNLLALQLAAILTPFVFASYGLYDPQRGNPLATELVQVIAAWFTVVAILIALSAVSKITAQFSRLWIGSWFVTAIGLLVALRVAGRSLAWRIRVRGMDVRRVLLIGDGSLARTVANRLQADPGMGFKVQGYFSVHGIQSTTSELSYLGKLDELKSVIAQMDSRPDQIWIVVPVSKGRDFAAAVIAAVDTLVDTRVVLDVTAHSLLSHPIGLTAGLSYVNLSASPMQGFNRLLKGVEDRILGSIALLIVSPLMLLVALGVRFTSPGPVFFRQLRHGWEGEEIRVWKFRSMYVQPDDDSKPYRQARRDDPRVTPFGRILRKTSLDELPQLFNVVTGSMSLVGPRPHPIAMNTAYEKLVPGYLLRHRVKPGITGWAQVNGLRGETETIELIKQRIEYDLYYIRNWSVWFDLAILLLTPFKGLVSSRAY